MTTIPRTDIDVFGLCLGGNVFGWTADREASFAVLDAYAAAGGNFIDTADVYMAGAPGNSGGESETIIGEWLAARTGMRDAIVIATKVRHPMRPGPTNGSCSRSGIASPPGHRWGCRWGTRPGICRTRPTTSRLFTPQLAPMSWRS